MTIREQAISDVIEREGGSTYTNRPADRGGPTRWGVTQSTAAQYGYTGDMRDYPKEEAVKVYLDFWYRLRLTAIEAYDADLAVYLLDYGVNSGPGRAGATLQRLLNVLNNRGKLYPDLVADGAIGPRTLTALEQYSKARGSAGLRVLTEAVNAMRIAFCVELAERQESQEENLYGWISRVCKL